MHTQSEFTQPTSPVALNVIIVGAGLGGLAAAISISLSGHHVVVFESAKELLEVGAGLQLTPNCTRILQRWSLPERLWKSATEPTQLIVHRYSGKLLAHEANFDAQMRTKYGAPFLDAHRVDLQQSLYARAKELGVQFNLGQRVENINFETTEITTISGTKATADLIVAADGLWSQSRNLVAPDHRPQPTGDLAYRLAIDLDQVDDEELREWIRRPAVHFWIGPGAHAVGYTLRSGRTYNIVLLVPDNLPPDVSRQPGSVVEMREFFQGWDPILMKFLNTVKSVDKWKLMYCNELESWVNNEGNLVFLGDACHPMLPYLAQGANSAIEDGAVLGLLLGHLQAKDQLPQALAMYQSLRKTRGEAIVRETFKQRDSFHMPDGPLQEDRDQIFLSQLGKQIKGSFPSRWTCPEVQPWLYGYDAFREVEQSVHKQPFRQVLSASHPADEQSTHKKQESNWFWYNIGSWLGLWNTQSA